MSTTIMLASQQDWSCQGAPQSTIVLGQGGALLLGDRIIDTNTLNQYVTTAIGDFDVDSQTYINCTFEEHVFDVNILSIIAAQGWQTNTNRSYSILSLPAFNTAYTPSLTNDTDVVISVSLTSTVDIAGTVDIQINSGSGFATVAELSISSLAATMTQVATVLVPAGASYQLVQSSGTSSIVMINEISR